MGTGLSLCIVVFTILLFFWAGANKAMEQTQQAVIPDWKGALISMGSVILFDIMLIVLAEH